MRVLNASSRVSSRGSMPDRLPAPTADEFHQSDALLSLILSKIRSNKKGSISFAEYMDLCLYAPFLGYYSGTMIKFGRAGDFVTAPLISSLFSQSLAKQCEEILEQLGGGSILEIGAGTGQMAFDLLLELNRRESLPDNYFIVEISPALKAIQQKKLSELPPQIFSRIEWVHELAGISHFDSFQAFQGVILANEVLDALPVHCFSFTQNQMMECRVAEISKKENKSQAILENETSLEFVLDQDIDLFVGYEFDGSSLYTSTSYTSEMNVGLKLWIKNLSKHLQKGVMLFIDYGFPRSEYYHPDRHMGTLMCHYRHFAHADPFFYPGLQDITAHVDFTLLAEAAEEAECEVIGYTNQASFLIGAGLIEVVENTDIDLIKEEFIGENEKNMKRWSRSQQIHLLTSPSEMGELFKVMALGKSFEGEISGFKLLDLRYKL